MSGTVVQEAVAALRAALAARDVELLSRTELVDTLDALETLTCELPTQSHRLLARLQAETTPTELGAKSWKDVLAIRWRISTTEAHRRLTEAALLGPRRALTGEPLPPLLPATAAAQSLGQINGEHVEVIRKAMGEVPGFVDAPTLAQIEVDLVRTAVSVGPKELKDTADRTLFLLDQDGPEPDEHERARKRGVSTRKQRRNAMTTLTGDLTPEAAAVWEAIFAKYAAPGMCNPDDENPCTAGTPSQIANRQRPPQPGPTSPRCHDRHRPHRPDGRGTRTPQRAAGVDHHPHHPAGPRIPRGCGRDRQRHHHAHRRRCPTRRPRQPLPGGVRQGHRIGVGPLPGQTRRVPRAADHAHRPRRWMHKTILHRGAYGSQVHHATRDWADGGNTNVDELGLACGADNRMVGPDGWTTQINERHEVEWIPPPHLDTGQARVNFYHQPERLLRPPDDPECKSDNDFREPIGEPESFHPTADDDANGPGGPSPPDNQAA